MMMFVAVPIQVKMADLDGNGIQGHRLWATCVFLCGGCLGVWYEFRLIFAAWNVPAREIAEFFAFVAFPAATLPLIVIGLYRRATAAKWLIVLGALSFVVAATVIAVEPQLAGERWSAARGYAMFYSGPMCLLGIALHTVRFESELRP